ncbi:hypothetical protein AO1008_03688 [Aspergillus oryzae 100-8]|uniref:Uncharacterized protein n=1 Tax=Aspergillus oryzae (strain 3.042) TaxID=1160506 RepID=I7ZKS0_ASPO3|nr:hypothetical protein Ao3042_01244 [Aspergillus oryzae 3.042]KDE77350.1 hypothetical protein AO1008_03688 [Aspergillus oryzae 100-8]|eukprot:EIT72534.1 hypothetical protein Ao3042_01244 [Aspergillus oryzae 3.042]
MEVLGLVTDRRDGDGDGKVRKEDEEEEAEERKEERVTMADEMVVVIMVMDGCWPIQYFSLSGHFLSVFPLCPTLLSCLVLFVVSAHPKHARRGSISYNYVCKPLEAIQLARRKNFNGPPS